MKIKINVASPCYGGTYTSEYVRSLMMLFFLGNRRGLSFTLSDIDYSDIVVSRNYLISNFYFMRQDCTHLLFVDSDMGYDAQMILDMLDLNEDLVGVLAPKRMIDLRKLHAAGHLPYAQALAQTVEFVGEPLKDVPPRGGFVQVQRCGTGIMLISRACIARMIERCPEIVDDQRFKSYPLPRRPTRFVTPFDKIRTETRELSEDFSFCQRWRERCDGTIWACQDRNIRHVGGMVVDSKFTDR